MPWVEGELDMAYMRIATNKFWGWVVVSLVVGLGIGLGIMLWRTGSLSSRITVLENEVTAASQEASAAVTAAQDQLAAAEASVTALSGQNAQLTAELAAAQAHTTASSGTSSTTTSATIAVVSRTITPGTAEASHTITLTAKVTGAPTSVTMRVYNASKSFDHTYTLKKSSTSGSTQTWKTTAKAPSVAGNYLYYATAIKGSTRVTMKGTSPSTLKVE